jgi:hypothetical protein
MLAEPGADLRVAVDESVFRRSGRKVLARCTGSPARQAGCLTHSDIAYSVQKTPDKYPAPASKSFVHKI